MTRQPDPEDRFINDVSISAYLDALADVCKRLEAMGSIARNAQSRVHGTAGQYWQGYVDAVSAVAGSLERIVARVDALPEDERVYTAIREAVPS